MNLGERIWSRVSKTLVTALSFFSSLTTCNPRWQVLGMELLQGGVSEASSMFICRDKSDGPSWTLMNSIVLDYRTPGADLARIPAMRESFIGCICTNTNWFLTVDVITVVLLNKAMCFSRERKPVCSTHKSECVSTVQWIYPSMKGLVWRLISEAVSSPEKWQHFYQL